MERLTGSLSMCTAVLPALWVFSGELRASPTYTDVTSQMGISVPGLGSGTAWGDFDGDGDMDLLASSSSYPYQVHLYRNDGSVFVNVTSGSGLDNEARNFAVGDYDNDGLDDVAFISFGYENARLFHNLGGMQFDDVSDTAGIYGTYSWRCAWVDHDRDGMLDLYLCGSTSYLFRNLGEGGFEETAASAGIQAGGRSCAWLDYDNDGDEDCYVGRTSANLLYRNNGDGTFTEVGSAAGVNDTGGTSGVCAGDFDGDGFFDLYSVNINSPSNRLYRNLGDGTFQDVTSTAGVGDVGDGRTATFIDIDYDGLVDIFTSNHVNPNRLYRNMGNGTFTDIAPLLNITSPPDPFGTGFADFDNDGDMDLFLATHFGNKLLRCDGMANQLVRITLIGTVSNRSAIGAVARCVSGACTTYARVDGGHGMGDSDSRVLGFGLGNSAVPVEITVFWPSGIVEVFHNLPAGSFTVITESQGTGTDGSVAFPVAERITAHPVPAVGTCFLELESGSDRGGPFLVLILDVSGRVVRRESIELSRGFGTLAVSGLPPGVYSVAAFRGEWNARVRMVILR